MKPVDPTPELLVADRPALATLERKIASLARRGKPHDRLDAKRAALLERSAGSVAARRARIPALEIPGELPIAEHEAEIVEALRTQRVVVVAGETGSGKTTQLPKLALRAGLGVCGRIGHTQPRRIAARSVAARIAEETGGERGGQLGELIGFQTRFEQATGPGNLVKVMTDGILLAETRSDPELRAYDCLIIDEAHERSLNIDFLLGYLRRLLERRDDLVVVITSATIDLERFAGHFAGVNRTRDGEIAAPPVIEVSGRTFPVDVRYLDPETLDDPRARDATEAGVLEALAELRRLEKSGDAPPPWARDVLVFLPGEREIRDLARALKERLDWPGVEVLPLYGRLSGAEQRRVFDAGGARRVVLATNVAETSLTVPRIGYVIDTGLARISRYSFRSKFQRLPVEAISRASARQRAGRCGRLAPGVCIRLYSEEDFEGRPEFTDPEILRTNLAAVLLQMAELGLGAPEDFPFVEAPDPRALADGRRLLFELGALDDDDRLTGLGRDLARLPVDPRLGRMVLAARERDCLAEVLIIVSALAGQDPRERPPEKQQAADEAHQRFAAPGSDFLAWVNLWRWLEERREALSANAFRRECQRAFLSFVRIREWRATHRQLHLLCRERGWRENRTAAASEQVHRALLPGLLSQLGMKTEDGDYLGARGAKFNLFPGSSLFRSAPPWVLSAEIVETSRVYARVNARIDPRWIEPEAKHLVRYQHEAPRFSRRQGRAVVTERVTLFGLPIVEGRQVALAPLDPAKARELFLLDGLARGGLATKGRFLAHNQALLDEVAELEARGRRRDLAIGDEALAALYGERIPADVVDGRSFEKWRRRAEREDPEALRLRREDLLRGAVDDALEDDFPGVLRLGALELELGYAFAPGRDEDGVTVRVPRTALAQLRSEALEWLVPGFLEEKCVALLKALPKRIRRELAPVPDHVAAVLPRLLEAERFRKGSLRRALTAALAERFDVEVPADAWDLSRLESHLVMRIEVLDDSGRVLAVGRDLAALQAQHAGQAAQELARSDAAAALETRGLTAWDFGDLPERVKLESGVSVFPALVDEGESVALRLLQDPASAEAASEGGVLRLLMLAQRGALRQLARQTRDRARLQLLFAPYGDAALLAEQIARVAVRRAHGVAPPLPRDAAA
ncbi:MAG: ATP-dependent RNA helicase HrpA, partial [Pseudomonadales bacterium]|nr:ATP-dependent RNA helicase HrpA [Pseudomonadales bacterium]